MVYRNNKIGGGSTEGYRNRLYALENLAVVTGIDVRPWVKKAKPFSIEVELVIYAGSTTRHTVVHEETLKYEP